METIKVRELAEPIYAKVKDIVPGKSGYNLHVKVVSKNVLIDIQRLDKTRVVIADFVVGDETGIIKMRLRNENFVDIINEGETITIRNCKIPVINDHMRMQVDAFGKIEPSQFVKITEVKLDKDLSAVTYENLSHMGRPGNSNRNDYNNNRSYGYKDNKSYQTFSVNDNYSEGTFRSSQAGN